MKVILSQDVATLGHAGELKDVADGYARNFLIPRGLAHLATTTAVKQAASHKQVAERKHAKAQAEVKGLAATLSKTQLVFKAKVGEQHRLFGSITSADIAEELSRKLGQTIEKRNVELAEPIRHLGEFKVPVHLAPKVEPDVTVVVEPEE
ncbi:MAG: 50S ribosomal protein L9 [Chloroflexota bacterium]